MNNFSNPLREYNQQNFWSKKRAMGLLAIITVAGIILRLIITPFDIPTNFDAFGGFFLYALDISILGHLPNYTLSQSGWGEFLSLFFMIFHSEQLIDFTNLQRIISVTISGVTVIPIYFICRKFFSEGISLIGSLIFALEPRIILNSTLGISEPLYILAISLGILFFLNTNKKILYLSFSFIAWATIIRPEGQFWFFAFTLVYFIKFRKNSKDLIKFLFCLGIFLLILSPIVIHRMECCGDDAIFGRILAEIWQYQNNSVQLDGNYTLNYGPNISDGIKLFIWAMIPIFLGLIPFGIILIFKNKNFFNSQLLIILLFLIFPILYSVSIAPDTRYVLPIFPILIVISLYVIQFIGKKINNKKIFFGIIISLILVSSTLFIQVQRNNYDYDRDAFLIASEIFPSLGGINKGTLVEAYMKQAEIQYQWPITKTDQKYREFNQMKRISIEEFNDINDFINYGKNNGLTHLVVDDRMSNFLKDIYENGENYRFLKTTYDSNDYEFYYKVKVFEIDFEKFD